MASSPQPTALTKPVEAGGTFEIIVQAVNGSAKSVPSDSILFTVTTTVAKAEAIAAEAAPLTTVASNGNGSAKSNGNGSRTMGARELVFPRFF